MSLHRMTFWAQFTAQLQVCSDCEADQGVFYMLGGVTRCEDCFEKYLLQGDCP
jgi:hypothetical protein